MTTTTSTPRRMGEIMVCLELQVSLLEEEAAVGGANDRPTEIHYFLMNPSIFDSANMIWDHIGRPLCARRTGSTVVVSLESAASSLCSSIQSHVRELLASPNVGDDASVIQAAWKIYITANRCAGEPVGPGPSTPASSSTPQAADGDDDGEKVCIVCMEKVSPGETMAVLPCSHQYHDGCILRWLQRSRTCPHCRFMMPTSGWFASTFNVRSGDGVSQ